jgi:hypothetical protein
VLIGIVSINIKSGDLPLFYWSQLPADDMYRTMPLSCCQENNRDLIRVWQKHTLDCNDELDLDETICHQPDVAG